MKEGIALYPFCKDNLPFVRNFDRLQNQYVLRHIIAPPGLAMEGMDAGSVANLPDTGYQIENELKEQEEDWNTLLVTALEHETDKLIEQKNHFILRALRAGKKVHYIVRKSEDISQELIAIAKDYEVSFHAEVFCTEVWRVDESFNPRELGQVKTPVVLVGGLVEDKNITELLAQLTVQLYSGGFHPCVVSKDLLGSIFGFHSMYGIFNEDGLTESEKMEEISHYFQRLEAEERPDIILIEAPDAMIKFNKFAHNGFGIQTYMLTQAVPVDYLLCCIPFELTVAPFVEELNRDFKMRYGCEITAVQASNIIIDSMDVVQKKRVTYVYTSTANVMKYLEQSKTSKAVPVFNIFHEGIEGVFHSLFQ